MADPEPMTVRERYRAFVARHEVAWELGFAGLAIIFVAMAFVPVVPGTSQETVVLTLEWIITGVFIAEFSSRLWAADGIQRGSACWQAGWEWIAAQRKTRRLPE